MRLLVSSTEAPFPPLGGLGHGLRELLLRLRHRHEIDLVTYLAPGQEEASIDGIRSTLLRAPTRSSLARSLSFAQASVEGKPLRAVELKEPMSRHVHAAVRNQRFDAVHIWGLPLAALGPSLRSIPSAMVVLDAWHLNAKAEASAASRLARPLKRLEHQSTVRFERRRLRHFDRVVTVSDRDASALTSLDPAIKTTVIPYGVDANYFAPGPRTREDRLIVFVGTLSWAPNVQAVSHMIVHVLPRVRKLFPDARFAIVGRGLAPSLEQEWQALPGVSVVGEVADVRPWLRRAHVVVCPMVSGTGIKNKLLEALAAGLPCVTTALACQGTSLMDRRQVLIADRPEDFASCIADIFADDQLAEKLANAGRSYVLEKHSWDRVAERFDEMYTEITHDRRARPDGLSTVP